MSLPGPPPADNETNPGGTEYCIWSSDPDSGEYYQETLGQLADLVSGRLARWRAILMLRVLRLRLERVLIEPGDFKTLAKWGSANPLKPPLGLFFSKGSLAQTCRQVYRVGRLSEVGIQLGCRRIIDNPFHIDVDWYGVEPLHHWWNGQFTGMDAEREAARGNLHFLEETVGLLPSPPEPAGWSWPAGTHGASWTEKLLLSPTPKITAPSSEIVMEWHLGELDHEFKCGWLGSRFWYSTPGTGSPDTI